LEASEAILSVYKSHVDAELKADGSPVTVADKQSNTILTEALKKTGIPIISEESCNEDFAVRKDWKHVWIVDPLDGTKEFLKKNGQFVICIALVEDGVPVLGIICSPVNQEILVGGSWHKPVIIPFDSVNQQANWSSIQPKEQLADPLVIVGSQSHHTEAVYNYHQQLAAEFESVTFCKKGSALKFFDLARGLSDVYPRLGPTMEWDIAAGHAIVLSLQGEVIEVNSGETLHYNKENLYNPFFVVNTKAVIESRK
jgi:3'(2'), 5'-bisphosphate nucleotidase